MKLDGKTVSRLSLPAGKADAIFFDTALPGFGLRIRNSNGEARKSWVVQYRHAGATRRLLIGNAEVLTAEQARLAAKQALAKVALGQDPQGDKATRRKADKLTLAAMVAEFLLAKQPTVRPATFKEVKRYLTGTAFKPLHTMPVDTITRREVAARLLIITRDNGPTTAARARSTFSDLYAWGMGQGLVESNPVIGTNRPKAPPSRDRVLSTGELLAIWNAAGDDDFGKVVKLLLLTGQRRSEVGGMAWAEINLERGVWTIPGDRTKNHREHTVALNLLALNVIKTVPRLVGRDLLFGARASRGFTSWAESKQLLDARLGDAVKPWTLHDLRRSTATKMCDIGVMPHVVEAVLNHQSGHKGGVAGIYNRSSYEREVRNALAMWADHVRSIIEGGERKVVAFQQS
jgi:integrase